MANYAQEIKAIAVQARAAQAAQNQAYYNTKIARMNTILRAEAAKGLERYELPESDPDFADWSSQIGLDYLASPAIGLTANLINRSNGRVLEISWSNAVVS